MLDVITIGTASRDVYLMSSHFMVLKDKKHLQKIGFPSGEAECFALGSKVEMRDMYFSTGGGATNTAVTFARQGFKVATVVAVGNDQSGKDIISVLRKEGVTAYAVVQKNVPTAYATILLTHSGSRTVLVYRNPKLKLTSRSIPLTKLKARWAYIVPSDMDYPTLLALFKRLHRNKVLIAVNPSKHFISFGSKALKPLLKYVKVLLVNREEASYLTGVSYDKTRELFFALHELTPGIAVMTDGPKGVMVSDGFKLYSAGVFKEKKVVDRTGAGDSFGSAFVAGLIRMDESCNIGECNPDKVSFAIRLASANATSKVEHLGAKGGLLTQKEFDRSSRWVKFPITVKPL
ncbi:MAG: hypothetical protein COU08_01490 [Candidatus Harrisonbacteria bacterium CG10_big_fil_rev_8_21_14_0_10_42_17]|uniref:Carbohydrate kinase PfkB domain-containing protein n=1 Tax=Candidatus Harrisonbacteria bacterium CG10_big_fil_rev_8_21_14_0_10_42_17 TaxID=1974584 RepID=A0A2M6WIM7_9BACT|nr:MAG: hypothetical protein COU08_01490 [Candidatus Harrisonbacteria bacterium CG10_big_fil_rev_8_21_14_0_10_42_17]